MQAVQPIDDSSPGDPFAQEREVLRDKILFTLEIFPFISRSMLHMAIGTAVSRRLWSPILDQLIAEGEVCEITVYVKTPANRNQQHIIYHLKNRQYKSTHEDIKFTPLASADAIQSDQ